MTSSSMTRYGSAYFLSSSVRRKMLLAPLYSIFDTSMMAAADGSIGVEAAAVD